VSDYRLAQCNKMLDALRHAGGAGLTRKDFAILLGIKKSTHLVGLIKELVERDMAFVKQEHLSNGLPYFRYFPIEVLNLPPQDEI